MISVIMFLKSPIAEHSRSYLQQCS